MMGTRSQKLNHNETSLLCLKISHPETSGCFNKAPPVIFAGCCKPLTWWWFGIYLMLLSLIIHSFTLICYARNNVIHLRPKAQLSWLFFIQKYPWFTCSVTTWNKGTWGRVLPGLRPHPFRTGAVRLTKFQVNSRWNGLWNPTLSSFSWSLESWFKEEIFL